MPKEQIRKRGKRRPKVEEETAVTSQPPAPIAEPELPAAGPSGIHPSRVAFLAGTGPRYAPAPEPTVEDDQQQAEWQRGPRMDQDYPFGQLDPDLKAYFRDVEEKIRDWEGVNSAGEEREDRQMFLTSVLSELRGHELVVATDPDTAVVLERLLPSLGDWGRRVIGDAIGDQWEPLLRHRFGSHILQTWMTLAADTLDREANGTYPSQHHDQAAKPDEGTLPTMESLVSNCITALLPTLPQLLTHPHASPPLRLLLLVISPGRSLPSLEGGDADNIRSKKSGKFRKNQNVQGKSIFGDENGKGKAKAETRQVPEPLAIRRKEILEALKEKIQPAEWRSIGVDPVGCPMVQLLLDIEAEEGVSTESGSILDHLTEGLASNTDQSIKLEAQPYLSSLFASPTSSHLFEAVLSYSPHPVFLKIWSTYFEGKVGKLAAHPYANFVIAKGVGRLDETGIQGVMREVRAVQGGRGLIKTARTSVLQALVERVKDMEECRMPIIELLSSALDIPEDAPSYLVPCLMSLKTYPLYQALLTGAPVPQEEEAELPEDVRDPTAEDAAAAAARYEGWKNRRAPKSTDELGPNMQGCLLLQGLLSLAGANMPILESLLAQDTEMLLKYAASPIASHFLDAILMNPVVPPKYRRQLMSAFMGHYRALAEDRMGSRVADTIWDRADGFMREKIARSLIPDATSLGSSQYGRFFARKLNLHLLDRRPDEWREVILGVTPRGESKPVIAQSRIVPRLAPAVSAIKEEKVKRRDPPGEEKDAIDDLFANVEKPKKKKRVV